MPGKGKMASTNLLIPRLKQVHDATAILSRSTHVLSSSTGNHMVALLLVGQSTRMLLPIGLGTNGVREADAVRNPTEYSVGRICIDCCENRHRGRTAIRRGRNKHGAGSDYSEVS